MRQLAKNLMDTKTKDLIYIQLAKFYVNLLAEIFSFDSYIILEIAGELDKSSDKSADSDEKKAKMSFGDIVQGFVKKLIHSSTAYAEKLKKSLT